MRENQNTVPNKHRPTETISSKCDCQRSRIKMGSRTWRWRWRELLRRRHSCLNCDLVSSFLTPNCFDVYFYPHTMLSNAQQWTHDTHDISIETCSEKEPNQWRHQLQVPYRTYILFFIFKTQTCEHSSISKKVFSFFI